jgi:PPOX class probable F420-dependent enzyme
LSNTPTTGLAGHKYVNLRTYRKNGVGVDTPVWFAEKDGKLYVYSLADAGKVKRIRNNAKVQVAPCDLRGNRRGQWTAGTAQIMNAAGDELGHRLLNQKYGFLKRFGDVFSRLRKRKRVVIGITLEGTE